MTTKNYTLYSSKNRRLAMLLIILLDCNTIAASPVYEIHIKDHLFYPTELIVPANQKIKLIIYNNDPTPEEFESYELNREKVIMGNHKATVFIGPLKPGIYPYFGEYNPKTAQGTIIAK